MVSSHRCDIERRQGVCCQWKAEGQCAVSGTTVVGVQNQHLKPLSHQHKEVEVRREKGTSEARVRLGSPIDIGRVLLRPIST